MYLTTTKAVVTLFSSSLIMSSIALTLHLGLYGRTVSCVLLLGALRPETLTFRACSGNWSSAGGIWRSLTGSDKTSQRQVRLQLRPSVKMYRVNIRPAGGHSVVGAKVHVVDQDSDGLHAADFHHFCPVIFKITVLCQTWTTWKTQTLSQFSFTKALIIDMNVMTVDVSTSKGFKQTINHSFS